MVAHLVRMGAMTLLILACMFFPFLPGGYDPLAVTLSGMAQLFGVAGGLLLIPVGALWLIFRDKGYYFAIAAVIASSMVAAIATLGAFFNVGLSLGLVALALWTYCLTRIAPKLKLLKNAEAGRFNPAPLYLLVLPAVAVVAQFSLVGPAIEFSRRYAIAQSAELINDIEEYHKANGRYPVSLLALHKDYKPSVIGIDQFHYEPSGDAYNVFFEQFSNELGAREIVMYNKLDEHFMASHAQDILLWTPEQLRARRGYFAIHDAAIPHWKYFWFD